MTLQGFGLSAATVGVLVAVPMFMPALLHLHWGGQSFIFFLIFAISVALIPSGLLLALIGWLHRKLSAHG